ncbi:unnamed protein product [Pylaiella littoralis]
MSGTAASPALLPPEASSPAPAGRSNMVGSGSGSGPCAASPFQAPSPVTSSSSSSRSSSIDGRISGGSGAGGGSGGSSSRDAAVPTQHGFGGTGSNGGNNSSTSGSSSTTANNNSQSSNSNSSIHGGMTVVGNGLSRAGAGSGAGSGAGVLPPPGHPISRTVVGGGSIFGPPFSGSGPSRKRGDSEEGSETTPRGSTPGGSKRRRRDGTDFAGHRLCVFKLTADENVGFMDRMRELFEARQLCDVTLRVEGEEFRAHKAVLACSKSFLGALMMSSMREKEQDVIDLEDISAQDFKILLDYMYNKPISVPSSQMVDLLALTNRYQVEGLKAQMCTALSTYLDHDNACSVFAAADSYQCRLLKEEAFSKIVQHFALAARSDGWLALTKDQLTEVISSDLVMDCDESVVFDAAARWLLAKTDALSRRKYAPEVLGMIRFPLMDAGLLSDVIKGHEATKGPECQKLIAEAWEHHALKAVGRQGLTGTPRTKQRRRSCSFKKHTLLTEHQDAVSALAVVNGKLVSGSWDTSIKVWDPQSWTSERTLSDHTGPVRCSGCAGRLASGSDDGTIKLWNTANWQCEVILGRCCWQKNCRAGLGWGLPWNTVD